MLLLVYLPLPVLLSMLVSEVKRGQEFDSLILVCNYYPVSSATRYRQRGGDGPLDSP